MKKIISFIVEKRYYILTCFILLSFLSIFASTKVPINKEISKYLPESSETKIGMKLMDKNFEETKESNLYVMFKNLDNSKIKKINNELSKVKNVSSVELEEKDNYSLFNLKVDDYDDSKTAKTVYNTIKEKYKNEEVYFGGSIDDANKEIVQSWILVSAVIFAMIILIIMCESYIEPFLFLFVIGLAIFLNKGTNIIFEDVSNITNSIAAILQLALSMDYSIILTNRYSQEKEKYTDKKVAMKNALENAFKSISSSSLTTIVGLLALVFMSFSIGKDLGFVLAKGVLFSLLSIFLCLPALILLFDKLITKTKKKSLKLNLTKFGNISYKLRFISSIVFLVLFISSFLLKGNLNYLYTGAEQDEIAKHFNKNNQMAIIYENKYEKEISNYCKNLNNKNIDEVLCFGNTIGEEIKYDELNNKFKSLKNDTEIDEYLIKIIYYYYNNPEINNEISLDSFISFIENTIYNNENLNKKVDLKLKEGISKLKNFSTKDEINKDRSLEEISSILDIDKEKVKNIFTLYHKNDLNIKLTINEFANFMTNNIINNKDYNYMLNKNDIDNIKLIYKFSNTNLINNQLNSNELSNLFNIDKETIDKLLLLYYSKNDTGYKMSINDFILGIEGAKEYIPNDYIEDLAPIIKMAKNPNNINNTLLSKEELKAYFGEYGFLVDLVYSVANLSDDYKMTPIDFVKFSIEQFGPYLDSDSNKALNLILLILTDSVEENRKLYTAKEMSELFGLNYEEVLQLYSIIALNNGHEFKLSPYEFVNFILENKSDPQLSSLDENSIKKLILLNKIMNDSINNTKFDYNSLSDLLGLNKENTKLLYSLYDITYSDTYKLSINTFINFIISDVINNNEYKTYFDDNSVRKLNSIKNIINNSLDDKKYSNDELYSVLSTLDENINKNDIDLVYIYYGSIYDYNTSYTLTIEKFINYLNDNILNNNIFKDFIDSNMKNKIIDAKSDVEKAKNLLVGKDYSRVIINTTYKEEAKNTFDFIKKVKKDLNTKEKNIYLIGDSPMAEYMDLSFGKELNYISAITMIAIFIVVALTFKSIIIPFILVLVIECSVFITMSILSFSNQGIFFIAILIVQSILMGATIDYAIVYTSYYKENRENGNNIIKSIINSYNNSIHTILTSALILIIVTFIVGCFAEAIAAKICMTISKGTFCSSILILFLLPGMLACFDKLIIKNKRKL